jgi:predicted metal-dependent phosphoesterase TrpH
VRNREILKKLREQGCPLEESDIIDSDDETRAFGRVHIALALLRKGYISDPIEAFKRYIGNDRSCYVSGEKCSVAQGVEAIKRAKGKAVLAHPHIIKSKPLVRKLLELPFDGLEAYYGRFSAAENEQWVEQAVKRGLFVTGGSDFHGLAKPDVSLGVAFAPETTFELLLSHFNELSRLP